MFNDWPTLVIVALMLAIMLVANEIGFRFGQRTSKSETERSRTVSNTLKGSVFALVALLLGFSFSATTSRFDMRKRLVLDHANAIGTCYNRAGLLDDDARDQIRSTLRRFVAVRLEQYRVGNTEEGYSKARVEGDRLLAELWSLVEGANRRDPTLVRTSQIVPAANEVSDLSATRTWANQNHLPDLVLLLLLAGVVTSAALLGHSSGQVAHRHLGLWLASNIVFALVLYVVLDFDRPRRGLIQVDQSPLVELSLSIEGTENR